MGALSVGGGHPKRALAHGYPMNPGGVPTARVAGKPARDAKAFSIELRLNIRVSLSTRLLPELSPCPSVLAGFPESVLPIRFWTAGRIAAGA